MAQPRAPAAVPEHGPSSLRIKLLGAWRACPTIRAKVARGIARLPRTPQARVAKAILKRINEIYREEIELLAEIKVLIEVQCPQLLPACANPPAPGKLRQRRRSDRLR
ncbi:MAG TPA: hypothetical protein VFN55_04405 [Solirubrobacteraceae bacterium]|nr:hypothetical protein [Solirubrobacteraceae bacterium]